MIKKCHAVQVLLRYSYYRPLVVLLLLLHGHERKGLRFHLRNAINRFQFLQDIRFRRKLVLFPRSVLVGRQGCNHFEIQTASAHDTLDLLVAIEGLEIFQGTVQDDLGGGERCLVGVGRPFATPFASDRIEGYAFRNRSRHGSVSS